MKNNSKPSDDDKKDSSTTKASKKKKEEVNKENHETTDKPKKGLYFGYTSRIVLDIILLVIFLSVGTFLLNNSIDFNREVVINYSEKSNLDYKVYLKENEFYEEEFLGKDMIYVASLVDRINVDFDYIFNIADNENLDFNYSVYGKLLITNKSGTKSYFERTYTLLENKSVSMINNSIQNIKENLDIDYGYYNSLANSFNKAYGVDSESKLVVYMTINRKNGADSELEMDSQSIMSVAIPLSERAIDISLDYKEIDTSSSILKKKNISFNNIVSLVIAGLLIIFAIITAVRFVRKLSLMFEKKNKFDKYIAKLLKEYDRLIAESSTLISFEGKEIVKIDKFTELLDIHDNLQLPIMYYVVNKHQKCYFYINHLNTIYLVVIKAVDLENKK